MMNPLIHHVSTAVSSRCSAPGNRSADRTETTSAFWVSHSRDSVNSVSYALFGGWPLQRTRLSVGKPNLVR